MSDAIKAICGFVLPSNQEGFIRLVLDGEDGRVYRFLLPVDSVVNIADTITDCVNNDDEEYKALKDFLDASL